MQLQTGYNILIFGDSMPYFLPKKSAYFYLRSSLYHQCADVGIGLDLLVQMLYNKRKTVGRI